MSDTASPSAPAAPAAPAPAPSTGHTGTTPRIVTLPSEGGPQRSAVEQATEAALANIAAGRTADARVPAGNPAGGQFRPQATHGARELPAPEAGREAPAPEPAPGEVSDPAAAATPAEGQQAPAPDAEQPPAGEEQPPAGDEPEGDEADDPLLVTLPARREGEEDYAIRVDSPEAAERLRQLHNGYMRGEAVAEARAEIEEAESLLMQRDAAVFTDPVGYLQQEIGDPELLGRIALGLLTQPEVWRKIGAQVTRLDDPDELRLTAAETRAWRGEHRDNATRQLTARQEVQRNVQEITGAIDAITPSDLPPAQQQMFAEIVRNDLAQYARRHNMLTIPVEQVPAIIAHRLQAIGMDPAEATTRIREVGGSRRGASRPTPRPTPPAPSARPASAAPAAKQPVRPAPAARSGKQFVASSVRREAAAATPSAGAGAPQAGGLEPPRKADGSPMGIAETIAWHREQNAKGKRVY